MVTRLLRKGVPAFLYPPLRRAALFLIPLLRRQLKPLRRKLKSLGRKLRSLRRKLGSLGRERPVKPQFGYDIAAATYEQRQWFEFWRQNEAPIIREWLRSLEPGFGLDAGSGTGAYVSDVIDLGQRCVAMDTSWQMLKLNQEKHGGPSFRRPEGKGRERRYIARLLRRAQLKNGGALAEEMSEKELRGVQPLLDAAFGDHSSSILYVEGDISAIPFGKEQFDWILCTRVLTHAPDLTLVFKEFARVLKRGGECLISDVHPDRHSGDTPMSTYKKKISIEAHNYSIADFKRSVSHVHSLELHSLDEYYFEDLRWKPPEAGFKRLYRHANPAVFYVSRLKKL